MRDDGDCTAENMYIQSRSAADLLALPSFDVSINRRHPWESYWKSSSSRFMINLCSYSHLVLSVLSSVFAYLMILALVCLLCARDQCRDVVEKYLKRGILVRHSFKISEQSVSIPKGTRTPSLLLCYTQEELIKS